MNKTGAAALVSFAVLVSCHQEQAQAPQQSSAWGTPAQTNTTATNPSGNVGSTEQMPSQNGTATPYAPSTMPTTAPTDRPMTSAPMNTMQNDNGGAGQQMTWTDGKILQMIHDANSGEVDQAKLARSKATDPRVRKLAAMMLKEHTEADDKTMMTARQTGVGMEPSPASTSLESDVQNATSALNGQSGSDFDRQYIDAQVREHQSMLSLIDGQLMQGAQSTDVKNLVAEARAMIARHLQHAKDVQSNLEKK